MSFIQCVPFEISGEALPSFDRAALEEYNVDLGGVLLIRYTAEKTVVSLPNNMDERIKKMLVLFLRQWDFIEQSGPRSQSGCAVFIYFLN